MGIKLAHAMGAHVVAFTTSESKRGDARQLGADEVVVSRHADGRVTISTGNREFTGYPVGEPAAA